MTSMLIVYMLSAVTYNPQKMEQKRPTGQDDWGNTGPTTQRLITSQVPCVVLTSVSFCQGV